MMNSNLESNRFWEIDFFRGIAIILMIFYHIFFDIYFFDLVNFDIHTLSFELFLYPIGTIFLLLVGISLTLSYNRSKIEVSKKQLIKKFFLRGFKVFLLGLIITIVTFFILGDRFIIFGVLHCIGLSIIFSIPFIRYRFSNLFLGLIFVLFGIILKNYTFDFSYLLVFGFRPVNFSTVDFFPIFPWFGVVLIGISLGNFLYPSYKRRFNIPDLSNFKPVKFLGFLGKNSLLIYFLHQPIIVGFICLFTFFQ